MADPHGSCTCHNGDSYNWRMTTVACAEYDANEYPVYKTLSPSNTTPEDKHQLTFPQWGGTSYDTPSGRVSKAQQPSVGWREQKLNNFIVLQ